MMFCFGIAIYYLYLDILVSIMKKILGLSGVILLIILTGIILLTAQKIDLEKVLQTGGIFAIFSTVFAETGLLLGFFLPGDTLLFAAGFFASQNKISLFWSIIAVIIGAIFGNMMGYEIGRRGGKKLFKSNDSVIFHKKYVTKAETFFENHGGKTILFARFIPVVRTLAPLMAGTAQMNYKKFMFYNFSGAIIWGMVVTIIGYIAGKILGQYFNIDHYLLPIILIATFLTFGVSFIHALKDKQTRHELFKKIKQNYRLFKKPKSD